MTSTVASYAVHPAAELFPLLADDELKELAEDIRSNGLHEPVWLYDDPERGRVLLDGRNRYRACELAGVPVETRLYRGDDPIGFSISQNLQRRHLTTGQKAAVAVQVEPLYAEDAARRKARAIAESNRTNPRRAEDSIPADLRELKEGGPSRESVAPVRNRTKERTRESSERAAAIAGTSGRAVQQYKRVVQQAPELAEKVRRGDIALDAAEKEVRQRAKDAERRAREAAREEATAKALAAMTATMEQAPSVETDKLPAELSKWWQLGRHLLYCGDSTDPEFVERTRGARLAFADPPYNAGKADWDHGFVWAHDYLADSAEIVLVTPGISAIADFFAVTRMPYRWSIAAHITNGMTRGALGFGNWIYAAVFSRTRSIYRNAQDHMRLAINASTTHESGHESRKPANLLVRLIDLFTDEGDTVVDPFLGSGTTLFAADQTGRTCIGAELNPTYQAEIIARYGSGAARLP